MQADKRTVRVVLGALIGVAATLALTVGSAGAATVSSALGIPCTVQPSGVQFCKGDLGHRVPSFDGVPLDANVTLPPESQNGPFPLIVGLHGYGGSKNQSTVDAAAEAQRGYAVLEYSARGFGESCGSVASRNVPGCAKGWVHLADSRFEARDTQYLAGLLVDQGLVLPKKIGVTGASYGGGQTYELAALRNRIMKLNGKLAPWKSPDGTPMRIAAAAPLIGWTDLAYALTPNGNTLDTRAKNPYGKTTGVSKSSFVNGLYTVGNLSGFYAPPGADPNADLTNWNNRINQGEPYDTPDVKNILSQFTQFHSGYYVQHGLKKKKREKPAPILAYNAWTDDLFPADESLRYYNLIKKQYPKAEFSLIFEDGFGHMRASTSASNFPELNAARDKFFDRRLKGASGKPLGVETTTQACNGAAVQGPFITKNWNKQHRNDVSFNSSAPKTFDSTGGSASVANAIDPITSGDSCRTTDANDDSNTATYRLPAATGSGFTLLGAPTVTARYKTTGDFPQVDARLWDVDPGTNKQTLVARGVWRPAASNKNQTFQLHANGYNFAAGHVAKLELLGRDPNYTRPSNGTFSVTVSKLRLDLPTR
jgi:pimeloyl-ACP methyl ester carboxylesterase